MIYIKQALIILIIIANSIYVQAQPVVTEKMAGDSLPYRILAHGYQVLSLSAHTKKQDIQALGFQIVQVLDNEHYIVTRTNNPVSKHLKIFQYQLKPAGTSWKLSSNLKAKDSTNAVGQFAIKVWEVDVFQKDMQKLPCKVKVESIYTKGNSLIIETTYRCLFAQIVQLENVVYAELYEAQPKTESEIIDHNLVINKVNSLFHDYPDLNGSGITVSVKENKYDTTDIDLKGRHVASILSGPGKSSHSTIMATIVAGGGNTAVKNRGVAWGANITSSNFLNLLPDEDKNFDALEVSVQSHSYGTQVENFYGTLTQAYDICANHNPSLVHVFSVGNSGQNTDTIGMYRGVNTFANITGNYKQAKNLITVGSIDLDGGADPKVSKGPAYDGRVKPELVAFSTFGSSNSAAIVSGVVALLQQAHKQDNSNQLPASALVKAILFSSAEDVGPKGIDYLTGYGNVNAFRAINNLKERLYFSGSIAQNEVKQFTLTIPDNVRNLKITLVWNDPAAEPNSSKALVNDLDLELQQSNTVNTWKPWVLNPYPHVDSLLQLPQRKADRLNNTEQITISNPNPDNYTIKVAAYDLPVSPQEFFIAYQYDMADSFSWTFPTGTDNFLYYNSGLSTFRWESTYADSVKGKLEISTDKGNTWALIADTILLSTGNYFWQIPETFTQAIARMTINGRSFLTDTFTISSPMEVKVGFNCGDSVMLLWHKINNATSYTLFSLGEKYMEPIKTIADSSFVLKKYDYPTKLFAVAPNFSNALKGARSFSYDYDLQGVKCYFLNFMANNNGKMGIELSLNIGTIYSISKIVFERTNKRDFSTIFTFQNVSNTAEIYTDDKPFEGINIYRAGLELENGNMLYSDPDTVYFITQTPAIIFPNPIQPNEILRIYTQYEAGQSAIFKLYDLTGKLILFYDLASDRESIVFPSVRKGIYMYKLELKGLVETGKIAVF